MPYITHERRNEIRRGSPPRTEGELNYAITRELTRYVTNHGLRYPNINACLGACEGAKLEFYRRVAVPYEDEAIARNGDVYA